MTVGEFAKLINAALDEADRGGLSGEEQILVLELIVRSKREDPVEVSELPEKSSTRPSPGTALGR